MDTYFIEAHFITSEFKIIKWSVKISAYNTNQKNHPLRLGLENDIL